MFFTKAIVDVELTDEQDPMSLTKLTEAFAISQTDLPTSSSALEYLDMISPKMIDETKSGKIRAKQGLTVHDMEKLSLKDKVLSIMLNGMMFVCDTKREEN